MAKYRHTDEERKAIETPVRAYWLYFISSGEAVRKILGGDLSVSPPSEHLPQIMEATSKPIEPPEDNRSDAVKFMEFFDDVIKGAAWDLDSPTEEKPQEFWDDILDEIKEFYEGKGIRDVFLVPGTDIYLPEEGVTLYLPERTDPE